MRRWVAPIVVVILAALAGFAISHQLPAAGGSAQLAVEQRLMCPQCQQTRLDVCDRPICADMKADISHRLAAGEAADGIVASYRQAYGASVLSDQQPGGLAAVLPWVAIVVGLAALSLLGLRRRRKDAPAWGPVLDRTLDAELISWRRR